MEDKVLLDVQGLKTYFHTFKGVVKAVDNVSFSLKEGEILGIVGESGSGKSVTSFSILKLVEDPGVVDADHIMFDGKDLAKISEKDMSKIRGKDISMVFQDPMTSLNPLYTIQRQMEEVLILHEPQMNKAQRRERCIELLHAVGIPNPEERLKEYPNQFSGGMGEVIKHGLIRDREYFDWIAANKEKILAKDADTLKLLIQGSDFIKREVVEIDPTEQNERATLNFGHTLGHAIEKLKNFTMLHGHCVAVGALAAMNICKERGLVNQDEINAYRALMEYFSIPTSVSSLDPEEVIAATKNDKKMEAGVIKFILLDRVGHAYIDRTVTKEEMERALAAIFR